MSSSSETSLSSNEGRQYLLVARSVGGSRFAYGQGVQWTQLGPQGVLNVRLYSRYTDEGFVAPVGRELLVEVEGPADSLQEALALFMNAAALGSTILAVANNCAIVELTPKFILETTPGAVRCEHLEFLIPLQSGPPPVARAVRVEATDAFGRVLGASSEFELLWPAVDHYAAALQNYRPGSLVMALEHAAIAAQRLEKALVAQRCRQQRLTRVQLAETLRKELHLDRQPKINQLGPMLRKQVVFAGDERLEHQVMQASHGLEHGSLPGDQLQRDAAEVIDLALRAVRKTIIDVVDLSPMTCPTWSIAR
jgi:hypothetical protein